MIESWRSEIWVVKYCLKIIYPKFNSYTFLVFLAIKFRIWFLRKNLNKKNMTDFELKTLPLVIQKKLIKEYQNEYKHVLDDKCIILSRKEFIQLCSENLFYIDNGVLWLALKLTMKTKKEYHQKKLVTEDLDTFENRINLLSSQINIQNWINDTNNRLNNIRIVPIVGSTFVKQEAVYTTEQEYSNILHCFGLNQSQNVQISFHSVPSFDCTPKIAKTAEVSLIVNDYDLSNDFVKEVLNNYFQLPKLICENDIFIIELTPNVTARYHYNYLDLVENTAKLYFKCTNINNNEADTTKSGCYIVKPYFIVKGVTQLNLGENLHCVKPRDEYLSMKEVININILNLCPNGLKEKFYQMQDIIMPFLNGDINKLSSFLSSPIIPLLLLTGFIGSGRHMLVKILAKYNGLNFIQVDCNTLQSSTAKQTESKINSTIQKAKAASPVIVLLDNFEVFAVDPENNEDCRIIEYFVNIITDLYQNYSKHPIIWIAVTDKKDLKPNIIKLFLDKIHIPRLNTKQRLQIIQWFCSALQLSIDDGLSNNSCNCLPNKEDKDMNYSKDVNDVLQRLAAKTEIFLYGDLDTLFHIAMRESYLKQQNAYYENRTNPDLRHIREDDFNTALEYIRNLQSHHLDAPKIPKVYWEDIGGLEKLKKELLKTIEFPIKYPHLFKNSSLKRSGILLYGPPGCGKTLVAKAVSTELNVSFLSVKGPELLNMYIGQSEENVRKVFESARASSPCIVFLDELDALAPRRGAAGDSGGASDRVVSQLLAEIDGVALDEDVETSSFVFIMGATNRPDLLEQSLLRPGRLDKLTYVGPYCGVYEKTSVLKALCRKYKIDDSVSLENVAAALPERVTGADLLSVVDTARTAAIRELLDRLHRGLLKENELSQDSVVLGVSHLWHGIESFRPSVTEDELAYYESLQTQM
ncbi:hypothetical protein ACJJTC_001328 [Scirpophaga incertulas]